MIPVVCRVKHDPPNTYGDCLRACVAALLDLDAEAVPHFFHDGCDGTTGIERMRVFLRSNGMLPSWWTLPASVTLDQILDHMRVTNRDNYYLLFGSNRFENDHVVIGHGGVIAHDPGWYRSPLVRGPSGDDWKVCIFVPSRMTSL